SQTTSLSATGSDVTVSSASSSSSEFTLSGASFPRTIPAGQSVSLTVTFTPQTSGPASASLSFVSNASNSAAESLTGTGTVTALLPPTVTTTSLPGATVGAAYSATL